MDIKVHWKEFFREQKGAAMIIAMGAILVLTALGAGLLTISNNEYQSVIHERDATKAYFMAEAAVEKSIQELNADQTYTGTSSAQTLDDGQYEITVSSVAGNPLRKIVSATGYFPSQLSPQSKRVIRTVVYVDADLVSFSYAMQAGNGGITVGGSSTILGTLYSNQNISVTSSRNPAVTGDAYAHGTITGGSKISGTKVTGADIKPLPEFDMEFWQTKCAAGTVYSSDFSMNSGSLSMGPAWINGDMTLTGGTLTITGPIWVTGDISVSGNTIMQLDPDFGAYGTLVIADNTIDLRGSAVYNGTPEDGYIMFVSNRVHPSQNGISLNGGTNAYTNVAVYAKDSGISISGSGDIVSMCGLKLSITGSGDIIYRSGLASARFTASPGGGWTVQAGSWRESPE